MRSERKQHPTLQARQLQAEVASLRRIIKIQNIAIIGLSTLFLLMMGSTFTLLDSIRHPDTDGVAGGRFWEGQRSLKAQRLQGGNARYVHANAQQGPASDEAQRAMVAAVLASRMPVAVSNCPFYGCAASPVEMSELDGSTFNPALATRYATRSHVMITHRSNRQKPAPVNQDRAVLIEGYGDGTSDPGQGFFLGLYDGHDDNGHDVAEFCAKGLPEVIAKEMQEKMFLRESEGEARQKWMVNTITQAYVSADESAPKTGGGTTAITIIRTGNELYIANTGDSTAFVGIYHPPDSIDVVADSENQKYILGPRDGSHLNLRGKVTIHSLTVKHKANVPEERERIESRNGRVHVPQKNPRGARVIAQSSFHHEDVGLAMSRSIGDPEWTAIGVIPDPDVEVIDLTEFWKTNTIEKSNAKVFVVAGSDGLFDTRKPQFVANHVAYGLFEYRAAGRDDLFLKNLFHVAKKTVNMAFPIRRDPNKTPYRDDITFVAKAIEL
ncbi:hypothetical protein THAOC_17849 [Thalassiosira oceanica]|uniref:PPM-type phosphatase domain-containing protein n=1 Tax=Thalassiosira oceanica TaxID=159749 RepID=K0S8K0_THAOC|nr:hypothetical protein THAOC_17849 [Thalassiosira oceanica]|eukprot:EJK61630.1 hypothetical protein THAOC_17849 [Thalassiosira oceanica]